MKLLVFALTVLSPGVAQAATKISCLSYPVSFSILAPTQLNLPGTKLTIVADGMNTYTFPAVVNVVESAAPRMVLNITTLDGSGNENLRSSMGARIELEVEQKEGGSFIAKGPGVIQITKLPKEGRPPRMRMTYTLSGCIGSISNEINERNAQ